jgi:putative membrane protein
MRLVVVAALLEALVLPAAAAQIGNPAGIDPATRLSAPGVPAPNHANTQDKLFAQLAAAGGLAEVEVGKLADRKAVQNGTKEFARRMVEDHTKTNEQLLKIAKQASIPLPGEPGPDHKAMKAELEKANGGDFDRAYLQGQIIEHQKSVNLLQYEIGQGQNADLQKLAAETLPTVMAHLEMARGLLEGLIASMAQNGATIGRSTAPERADPRQPPKR